MAQSTISQRIALEGAQEVLQQLSQLGEAGERAIQQIAQASAGAGPGLSNLSNIATAVRGVFQQVGTDLAPVRARLAEVGEAASEVGHRLTEVASVLGIGLAAGIAGGVAGLFELIKSSAEAGHQLEVQAGTIGVTVEQLQAYRRVAADAGIDGDRVFTALVKLTQNLGKETEKLSQDTIKAFADLPAALSAAGTGVLRGSAQPQAGTNRGIFGIPPDAMASVKEYTEQFAKAQAAEGKAFSPADIERYRQSVIQLSGNVTDVGEKFRLAAAKAGVPFPALTQGEELKRNAEIAADPVLRLGVRLKDLQAAGAELDPVIRKIFDGLAAIPDTATKNATALALLGRGAKEVTDAFKGGSVSFDQALANLKESGLGLTPEQAALLAESEKELIKLGTAGTGLRNQLSVIFAPALIQAAEAFTGVIRDNAGTLKDWAETIATRVLPGITNLINQFRGTGDAAKGLSEALPGAKGAGPISGGASPEAGAPDLQDVNQQKSKLQELGETALSVASTLQTAFRAIETVLTAIANAINAVFGTKLTAAGLGAAIVVGTLTGAFTILLPLLGLVAAAIGLLGTPTGAITALLIALGASLIYVYGKLPTLQQALEAVGGFLSSTFTSALNGVSNILGSIGGAIQNVVSGIAPALSAIPTAISQAIQGVIAAIAPALSTIGSAISDPFITAIQAVERAFDGLADWVDRTARAILGFLQPVVDFISSIARGIGNLISGASSASPATGAAGASSPQGDLGDLGIDAAGLASGGHVGGPRGTDTIPAWLTPGEFVIRADAVRNYGVDLFRALNAMALPMRGFSLGGVVDAIGDALAPTRAPLMLAGGGGALAGGSPTHVLNLTLGNEQFSGLMAPGAVYDRLARHARASAIRSAGRKPSWFNS